MPGSRRNPMTSTPISAQSSYPVRRQPYYPWWLHRLADDATLEGSAMQGTVRGAEAIRTIVVDAHALQEDRELSFVGDYGDNGYLEQYTCKIHGEPTCVVVTVELNAEGEAQRLAVLHRPRGSVLLFARLMGQKYAGTPLARYFVADEP